VIISLAAAAIWAGGPVAWTTDDVVVGGYSVRKAAVAAVEADEREHVRDNKALLADRTRADMHKMLREHGTPWCSLTQRWTVLSVVGPIASYRQDMDEFCMPAAHPWGGATYHTLDARRPGKAVSLLDYFPDQVVLKALLADAVVRKTGVTARSAKELAAKLAYNSPGCEYGFDPNILQQFAFHHVEGGNVAVRIGLSHGCEAARGSLTQLGILLPIPPALKGPLAAAAKRQGGFLMQDQAAVSKGGVASLTWGKPY
jgi:hypothetical protein